MKAERLIDADKAETAFLVGQLSDIDSLPLVGRLYVNYVLLPVARLAYFMWGWTNILVAQSICSSKEKAREFANGPRRFYLELPVDADLPDRTCQFGQHDFPASAVSQRYQKRQLDYLAIPRKQASREMRGLAESVQRLKRTADEL